MIHCVVLSSASFRPVLFKPSSVIPPFSLPPPPSPKTFCLENTRKRRVHASVLSAEPFPPSHPWLFLSPATIRLETERGKGLNNNDAVGVIGQIKNKAPV